MKPSDVKFFNSVMKYFFDTTGTTFEDYTLMLGEVIYEDSRAKQSSDYKYWLLARCLETLKDRGIPLSYCIEQKDSLREFILGEQSAIEGEYYTPELWCKEGRKYLKQLVGDDWDKVTIWDPACYTMDTEIYTKHGWVTYHNLNTTDMVYSLNPETGVGEWVNFVSRLVKHHKGELYQFKGDGVNLKVTEDHAMYVSEGIGSPIIRLSAGELYKRLKAGEKFYIHRTATLDNFDYQCNGDGNCDISCSEYEDILSKADDTLCKCQRIDAFWRLVGLYYACGAVNYGHCTDSESYAVFKPTSCEQSERLVDLLKKLNITYTSTSEGYNDPIEGILVDDSALVRFFRLKCDKMHYGRSYALDTSGAMGRSFLAGVGALPEPDSSVIFRTKESDVAHIVERVAREGGYYVVRTETRDIFEFEISSSKSTVLLTADMAEIIPCEGEMVWDITLEKNHVFLVRRGGIPVFCGNCGTGNLLRTEEFDRSRLFMSTLLAEDADLVKKQFPGATVFQMNALLGIDFDSDNRMFLNQLPEALQDVIKNDKPLAIFMNPPYAVKAGSDTDVYYHMSRCGYGDAATDIYNQFLYRMCMLIDDYHLKNLYLGIYGPANWMSSARLADFRQRFFDRFVFKDGFMFSGAEFADVGKSIDFAINVTFWKARGTDKTENKIILDTCENVSGAVVHTGKQLIRPAAERMYDWCLPRDVIQLQECPTQTAGYNFSDKLTTEPVGTMGHLISGIICKEAVRSNGVLPYPASSRQCIPITPENYWRCVYSFAICAAIGNSTYTETTQVLEAPDTTIPGFEETLADCLAFMIFGLGVYNFSYRDVEICGVKWTRNNAFFPISVEDCKTFITDPVLLDDMEKHPSNNQITLDAIKWAFPKMSEPAKELMKWGTQFLINSLLGDKRKKLGYQNWLSAYDAGITHIRTAANGALWSDELFKEYKTLVSQLRTRIRAAAYTYGTLISEI